MILLKMRFSSIALILFIALAYAQQQDIEVNAEQSTLNQPAQETIYDVRFVQGFDVGPHISLPEGICRPEGQL